MTTYVKIKCPECGAMGQSSDDCTLAACPKCTQIYRISENLIVEEEFDENLMDNDLEDIFDKLIKLQ